MTLTVRIRKAAPLLDVVDELLRFSRGQLVKAALPQALAAREQLLADAQPAMTTEVEAYFAGLLSRAGVTLKAHARFPFDPDEDVDWQAEQDGLADILRTWYILMGEGAFAAVSEQLGISLSFSLDGPSTARMRELIGVHVVGITDTLRQLLRNRVEAAVAAGLSIEQLVAGTDSVGGLRELFGSRASIIALTETAMAYNLAAVIGYRDSGLVSAVEIFDGPGCGWDFHEDPDLADGSIRTLDEFEATPLSHPNCQRAAGPVVTP